MDTGEKVRELWQDYTDYRDENKGMKFSELGTDSFDLVQFVMDLESEFGIDISDDEAELLQEKTLDEVTEFVDQKIQEKKS